MKPIIIIPVLLPWLSWLLASVGSAFQFTRGPSASSSSSSYRRGKPLYASHPHLFGLSMGNNNNNNDGNNPAAATITTPVESASRNPPSQPGRRYSVAHILHPLSFPNDYYDNIDDDDNNNDDDNNEENIHSQLYDLSTALSYCRLALLELQQRRNQAQQQQRSLLHTVNIQQQSNQPMESDTDTDETTMIRIEIGVAPNSLSFVSWLLTVQQSKNTHLPMLYLQTQQRTVAAVGIASRQSSYYNDNNDNNTTISLPEHSVWYGTGRFDSEYPIDDKDPSKSYWNSLSDYWILPMIELVQQYHQIQNPNQTIKQQQQQQQPALVTLAVHVSVNTLQTTIDVLQHISGATTTVATAVPWQPLPPILSRVNANEEAYEDAVEMALAALSKSDNDSGGLKKVVLARSQTLHFGTAFSALHVVRNLVLQNNNNDEMRHGMVFYFRNNDNDDNTTTEFWGLTPEKLFEINQGQYLYTEALAGTRMRGATINDDNLLLQELIDSDKELRENQLTADFVESVLQNAPMLERTFQRTFGVRRLRHLQHICQQYVTKLIDPKNNNAIDNKEDVDPLVLRTARYCLKALHPTPAVGGLPRTTAMEFIRQHEGWDRGLYAGPVGYMGNADDAFIGVAIRSALSYVNPETRATEIKVFGGSGLVKGSTLHGEWSETNSKLAVVASLFPQSPVTLRSSPTPNAAWATAFCEELIRNGVTQFYICPGSRSTPLVVALVQAAKKNYLIRTMSVHDERSAGFRAVGYARGAGKPAVVVTSSGTATANLYPAVVEASMDGLPMILLTADRPYESRDTGANQAIDQVKLFSATYIRWFRDVLPPSDDVAVSAALSDACHAVVTAREARGPVHLNIQFRENLAPDAGPIRNDNRHGSVTKFNAMRFTDVPGFHRWSNSGQPWLRSYSPSHVHQACFRDIAELIKQSRRGIIVLGGLRQETTEEETSLRLAISNFAEQIGFPIVAGAQCASLRFTSSAVIPFAEHLFRAPTIRDNLNLDLVIQIGWPLISTAVPAAITKYAKENSMSHILVHPHSPVERLDAEATVTHRVSVRPRQFIDGQLDELSMDGKQELCYSELYPLVPFGKQLQAKMKHFVSKASEEVRSEENISSLTEPELMMDLAESFTHEVKRNLFLSSSMPVRDAEMFLYPYEDRLQPTCGLGKIACNRGASGIDGIVASALGFAEATSTPVTLVVGDLATLHDVGSFFSLRENSDNEKRNPLTTIIVNNNGGGIFSFLPIARHQSDVEFDTFFGTPTKKASFSKIAHAFGISASTVEKRSAFSMLYRNATLSNADFMLETQVLERDANVRVHARINGAVENYVEQRLRVPLAIPTSPSLELHRNADLVTSAIPKKTMLLLHGWMGSSTDWKEIISFLTGGKLDDWTIATVDLMGHGKSHKVCVSPDSCLQNALGLGIGSELACMFSVDQIASSVEAELAAAGIKHLDALIGYSAGGRVALSMKVRSNDYTSSLITAQTKLILIGANPGGEDGVRSDRIEALSASICKAALRPNGPTSTIDYFVRQWYAMPMWGGLQNKEEYAKMARRRVEALQGRGNDMLQFLRYACSPTTGNCSAIMDSTPDSTLFVAGARDTKYVRIGRELQDQYAVSFKEVGGAGHALLTEEAEELARIVESFLCHASEIPLIAPKEPVKDLATYMANSNPLGKSTEEFVVKTIVIQNTTSTTTNDKPSEQGPSAMNVNDKQTDGSLPNKILQLEVIEIMPISFKLQMEGKHPLQGIGWGEEAKAEEFRPGFVRKGFILQLKNQLGTEVGVGEVTPLTGVHKSSVEKVSKQINEIQLALLRTPLLLNSENVLALDGSLERSLVEYTQNIGLPQLSRALYAGLEMAILSMASQIEGRPLHQALTQNGGALQTRKIQTNGLITRNSNGRQMSAPARMFSCYKVKVGHQSMEKDQDAMKEVYRLIARNKRSINSKVRPDANRAWNESEAIRFAMALEGIDLHAHEKIEFIEEPLKLAEANTTLEDHVVALERNFLHTGIPYALDESIGDLAESLDWNFERMRQVLLRIFAKSRRGCAALVLKPTVLGLELSFRLAHFAREDIGIGTVFSSCFESGLGLAHTAMLAYASDGVGSTTNTFAHGLGTFASLSSDTLNPSFASYVDDKGRINVASLSRSLFGLGLDDLIKIEALEDPGTQTAQQVLTSTRISKDFAYEASSAVGPNEEINVVASVILPFTANTAFGKFTDLPAMSRWSPWIQNVRYDGNETEWTLNVRGVPLRWRATSEIINEPCPGIQWCSVAGIENSGTVEFVQEDDNESCRMNVDMKILPPRLLQPLFRNASVFLEDFLRDKLLKWSLAMFRDAVKADMALERYAEFPRTERTDRYATVSEGISN